MDHVTVIFEFAGNITVHQAGDDEQQENDFIDNNNYDGPSGDKNNLYHSNKRAVELWEEEKEEVKTKKNKPSKKKHEKSLGKKLQKILIMNLLAPSTFNIFIKIL